MKKIILILFSIFFVLLSFYPTLYEIQQAKYLPKERAFEMVHNYVFDYNFYLSRIREGQEGRWTVVEKYYNQPHKGSLFQIFYLYLGKIGGLLSLSPVVIYHAARVVLGLILLLLIGKWVSALFAGWWSIVAYLFVLTAGSLPILVKLGNFYRFSTHWGGWSAIDSLQRITFLPHVLLGQIFLVLFIWRFSRTGPASRVSQLRSSIASRNYLFLLHNHFLARKVKIALGPLARVTRFLNFGWGLLGLIGGIIFPPVLIVVYTVIIVLSIIEFLVLKSPKLVLSEIEGSLKSRVVFIIFSLPALLYLQVMFKIEPWQALAVFDIQHRSILPYVEYFLALGPMLPLGVAGLILALVKKEKKFTPFISWILSLGLLFAVFEHVPQQSSTRFTQMLINIPLGILTNYLFYSLWQLCDKCKRSLASVSRLSLGIVIASIILLGISVMLSMVGWLTDQARWKREATWLYPVGVQLVYPLKDFMDGIVFLKSNTKTSEIVLAYEAAGNYIPAYAGNFVYLGHANTPDEDNKLKIAAGFFKGGMSEDEAKAFLTRENIKYIYFGPQERELGGLNDLLRVYTFITPVYTNNRVTIYKFSIKN